MTGVPWQTIRLPQDASTVLAAAPSVWTAGGLTELIDLATRDSHDGPVEVAYDVPGKGRVVEATVCRMESGLSVRYSDAALRRRDPEGLVVGDGRVRAARKFKDRFGYDFEKARRQTFDWLAGQDLVTFPFVANVGWRGTEAMVVAPANAAFFALALAMSHGILDPAAVPDDFSPKAMVYAAPPFRHTHFGERQVAVYNRRERVQELFFYHLYPNPSVDIASDDCLLLCPADTIGASAAGGLASDWIAPE